MASNKSSSLSFSNTNGYHTTQPAVERAVCEEMCFYCFDVLINYLNEVDPSIDPCFKDEQFPLFVTWRIGRNKHLRGCIGTFESTYLHRGLKLFAIKSATEDERFGPISLADIANLHVSVSLLTNFEKAKNYLDWEVGKHGIKIKYFDESEGEFRSPCYLPEVASECGWNHQQTIDNLLRKGDYKQMITPDFRQSLKVTRYQSEKISVSYNDYVNWKNQVSKTIH